jgi:hypothetical protein
MSYVKTETGLNAFNTRSPLISARLRPAFILFDGIKTNEQILTIAGKLGVTQADIDYFIQQGFVANNSASNDSIKVELDTPSSRPQEAAKVEVPVAAPPGAAPSGHRTPQERYRDAKPLATMITAGMGFKGFRLNLAVERADGYDELLALFPKIQAAAGDRACMALEWALKG